MKLTMTEKELQNAVIEMAQWKGWLVAHFRPAQTQSGNWVTPVQADGKGFPDLFMLRGPRSLAVELKSDNGRVSPEQQVWIDAMNHATIECFVWRPEHWTSGLIERRLS